MYNSPSGDNNTAIGYNALNTTAAGNNTAVGSNSGSGINSGANNTIIGTYDGIAAPISANGNNYIVLSDGQSNIGAYWNGLTKTQFAQGPIVTQGYTVASLGAIASPVAGMRVHVTDANAPTFLATLSGGGLIVCPAFYDGTNWVAG
jgi:hypothetical protein